MIEHGGEIDRRRVTADADGFNGARRKRGRNNHEAQREQRKAPDQTQCQYSAVNLIPERSEPPRVDRINDMNAKEIKELPLRMSCQR
jgi:hypothetical protein